jgi:hypothetical protein
VGRVIAKSECQSKLDLVLATAGKLSGTDFAKEWNAHGEADFQYEILEVLDDQTLPMEVSDLLKVKKHSWMERLAACV